MVWENGIIRRLKDRNAAERYTSAACVSMVTSVCTVQCSGIHIACCVYYDCVSVYIRWYTTQISVRVYVCWVDGSCSDIPDVVGYRLRVQKYKVQIYKYR